MPKLGLVLPFVGSDLLILTSMVMLGITMEVIHMYVSIAIKLSKYLTGLSNTSQGQIQDLIRGGGPDRDRPKTAILGPQFCRILVLGPHFWWSGGARAPGAPPWIRPCIVFLNSFNAIYLGSCKVHLLQALRLVPRWLK